MESLSAMCYGLRLEGLIAIKLCSLHSRQNMVAGEVSYDIRCIEEQTRVDANRM